MDHAGHSEHVPPRIRVTGGGALVMNIATTASLALAGGLALYSTLAPPAQPTATTLGQSPSALTAYNFNSTEEQFAIGSDCRVYHRWQNQVGGQSSPWVPLGGCASSHQGLAVGVNGDGELMAFLISPDHTVRYSSQSRPGVGPWTGWTPLGGDVSTGLRVMSASSGSSPIQIFASDKSGNLWEDQVTQENWSVWRQVQKPLSDAS